MIRIYLQYLELLIQTLTLLQKIKILNYSYSSQEKIKSRKQLVMRYQVIKKEEKTLNNKKVKTQIRNIDVKT